MQKYEIMKLILIKLLLKSNKKDHFLDGLGIFYFVKK